MGDRYWVLPVREVGGHQVSGFASRDGRAARVLLYAHHAQDTQSRSDADFDVTLDLDGLGGSPVRVREYRFDRDHNSYFRLARKLRDRTEAPRAAGNAADALEEAVRALDGGGAGARSRLLKALEALGPSDRSALPTLLKLREQTKDEALRAAAQAALARFLAPPAYPRAEVEPVRALAECRATGSRSLAPGADGRLRLTAQVAGNGLNILIIEPEPGGTQGPRE